MGHQVNVCSSGDQVVFFVCCFPHLRFMFGDLDMFLEFRFRTGHETACPADEWSHPHGAVFSCIVFYTDRSSSFPITIFPFSLCGDFLQNGSKKEGFNTNMYILLWCMLCPLGHCFCFNFLSLKPSWLVFPSYGFSLSWYKTL